MSDINITVNDEIVNIDIVDEPVLVNVVNSPGVPGAPGVGVPVGGTTGQVLAKNSATNYDTEWVDVSGGAWGTITGTLSNQTDLQTALNGKFDDPTGTSAQYIRGDGSLATFPSLTGYVPYTGATGDVDLGTHRILAQNATIASSGSGDTATITHSSGSGIGLNITKGGNGEGLYINKTGGSGNAATIIGTINATTLVKSGGTSSQFLKADGTVDSSVYVPTSREITINGVTYDLSANRSWTVAAGISGSGASGQVAYWTGTSSQSGDAGLTWDTTNKRLVINTSGQSTNIGNFRGANSVGENIWIGGGGTQSVGAVGETFKGSYNTSIGNQALNSNTTGYNNLGLGYQALYTNTTGYNDTAFGSYSLYANTIGYQNVAFGMLSLRLNTEGFNNTAIGHEAGRGFGGTNGNTTGSNNIFIGFQSVGESSTASNRTFIGNTSTTSTWLGGNLLLGSRTDSGQRLQVQGTTLLNGNVTFSSATGMTWDATNSRLGLRTSTPGAGIDVWNSTAAENAQYRISDSRVTMPNYSSVGFSPATTTNTAGFFALSSSSTGGVQFSGFTNATATATPFFFVGYHGSTAPTVGAIRFLGFKHDGSTGRTALTGNEIIAGFAAGAGSDVFQVRANGNTLINSTTDGGQRLQVQGTTLLNGNVTFSSATGMFWDATNSRLGIGTNAPAYLLEVLKNQNTQTSIAVTNTTIGTGASTAVKVFADNGRIDLLKNSSARTPYKILGANDGAIYNYSVTGNSDIAILNEDIFGRIKFGAGSASTAQMTLFATGNLAINSTTDSGERLQVTGDVKVVGSGSDGGTFALTAQNSAGVNTFRVRNDGYILIGQASTTAAPAIYAFSGTTGARSLRIGIQSAGSITPIPAFNINQESNYTYTSGTGEFTTITANFLPTSGTGTLAYLSIKGTINQTGGANGITRGLYVNPTLTAAADFRAIETARGNVVFGNLPTSPVGLPTGAIWNNLGMINIV
jgi:hypothetical protein